MGTIPKKLLEVKTSLLTHSRLFLHPTGLSLVDLLEGPGGPQDMSGDSKGKKGKESNSQTTPSLNLLIVDFYHWPQSKTLKKTPQSRIYLSFQEAKMPGPSHTITSYVRLASVLASSGEGSPSAPRRSMKGGNLVTFPKGTHLLLTQGHFWESGRYSLEDFFAWDRYNALHSRH